MKDTLKENIAKLVQTQLMNLMVEDPKPTVSGLSAPPGCGMVQVENQPILVRIVDKNETSIYIKTPAGPRYFTVKFAEVY